MSLVIVSTHPIQYHAPVYRYLQQQLGVDLVVIYGSDQGITKYHDKEFGITLAWDTDLLSGYKTVFLNNVDYQANQRVVIKGSSRCLENVIDGANPTAVLILGYAVCLYQRAWLHAKIRRYPVFFRMETQDKKRGPFFLKQAAKDFFLRHIYRYTDAFLYLGNASLQHYLRLGVTQKKLFFSPYGVDSTPFKIDELARSTLRANKRRELGIQDEDFTIIFSGKFIAKKNPLIILEALGTLPEGFQKKVVVLYLGDGPLKSQMVSDIKNVPRVRIIFCGFQNQTQLSSFYHASDFLVLPSLYNETWGLVVNEAMVHGLSCVVSDHVGCHKDLIEQGVTGEVFHKGDKYDLARAIVKVSLYCKSTITQAACQKKVSPYSISAAAEGIALAYHDMTRKKNTKESTSL